MKINNEKNQTATAQKYIEQVKDMKMPFCCPWFPACV